MLETKFRKLGKREKRLRDVTVIRACDKHILSFANENTHVTADEAREIERGRERDMLLCLMYYVYKFVQRGVLNSGHECEIKLKKRQMTEKRIFFIL